MKLAKLIWLDEVLKTAPKATKDLNLQIRVLLAGYSKKDAEYELQLGILPRYTSSVDDALVLCNKLIDGHDWLLGKTNDGLTIHAQIGHMEPVFAETPAMALIRAALHVLIKEAMEAETETKQ